MKPDRKTLKRLYEDQGLSLREIGRRLGLTFQTVHYHLEREGILRRSGTKRSRLRGTRLEVLEAGVREKGVRGYAVDLGVHENTLRNYLKKAREAKSPRERPTV